ncbi:MAG: hypothetical protein MR274_04235 [Clostridium sp.]|nr:hypothetical protein [Clostridium sp.]MDY3828885.1 hypothetical protein [Clostridium sp.]
MEPFTKNYIIQIEDEYENCLKEQKVGDYELTKEDYPVSGVIEGYLYNKPSNFRIRIPVLKNSAGDVMRLCPKEIQGCYQNIKYAKGKVGVVGLGIGYFVNEVAKKDDVIEIIVYEKSQEVIDIYNNNFESNPKVKIKCLDAYEAERDKFDFFFVDTYEYNLTDKVVEDYVHFNKLHEIEVYSFFGVEHFLLSCSYQEIVWVYIPEEWMAMSKNIAAALDSSGRMEYYQKLDEDLVSDILAKFKVILNEEEPL